MKNNNKILSILLVVVSLPQLALASWWNPFSWFDKKPVPTTVQTEVNTSFTEKKITDSESKLFQATSTTPTSTKKVYNKPAQIYKSQILTPKTNPLPTTVQPVTVTPVATSTPTKNIVSEEERLRQIQLQRGLESDARLKLEEEQKLSRQQTDKDNLISQKKTRFEEIKQELLTLRAKYLDGVSKQDSNGVFLLGGHGYSRTEWNNNYYLSRDKLDLESSQLELDISNLTSVK